MREQEFQEVELGPGVVGLTVVGVGLTVVGVALTVGVGVTVVGAGVPVVGVGVALVVVTAPVQVVPLIAKDVGTGLEPLQEPLNPPVHWLCTV